MKRWHVAAYVALLALRLYFSLQPSYIHPDELFQGADAVVANIFRQGKSPTLTWEFTSSAPIRSIGPLYLFLSPALYLLKTIRPAASPSEIFNVLRLQQFANSLGIDALIYLLSNARRIRKRGSLANVLLFASSYTAWTFHTHTFSNSWETLLVLLALYLHLHQHSYLAQFCRGIVLPLGVFTRISFAFFLAPVYLLLLGTSFSLTSSIVSLIAAPWTVLALVAADSMYYKGCAPVAVPELMTRLPGIHHFQPFLSNIVLTPLNNVLYNADQSNLARHGLQPRWAHLVNLAVLMGPALFLLPGRLPKRNAILLVSAATGFLSLSWIQHQEARFLLPVTALLFTALDLDDDQIVAEEITVVEVETLLEKEIVVTETQLWAPTRRLRRRFLAAWIVFNAIAGIIFGALHQRGVISASLSISRMQEEQNRLASPQVTAAVTQFATGVQNASIVQASAEGTPIANKAKTLVAASDVQVAYYKTYPAPAYLLPAGMSVNHLQGCSAQCKNPSAALNKDTLEAASFLVVPLAFYEAQANTTEARRATAKFLASTFVEVARYPGHLDLDNLGMTLTPAWETYSDKMRSWGNTRLSTIFGFGQGQSLPSQQPAVKPVASRAKQSVTTPAAPGLKKTPEAASPEVAGAVPPQAPSADSEASATPAPATRGKMPGARWYDWTPKWPINPATIVSVSSIDAQHVWLAPVGMTVDFVKRAIEAQGLVLLKRRHPVKAVRRADGDAGAARRRVVDADWRMM